MTAQEAKQRLERIWKDYTSAYDSISEDDVTAFDMAISALQAQDVPDTNVGDMVSRRFVELLAEYPDPEICTYKEYKGKPYFSIKYIENGEGYIGYGTYSPKVLSQYLREYFMVTAQPEIAIPLSWIEKHIEWLKSMDNAFSNLTAMNISVMVKKWKEEKERKTNG